MLTMKGRSNMKITYNVKMTAQNCLGREYSVIQQTEYEDGDIVRKCLHTSEYRYDEDNTLQENVINFLVKIGVHK